LDETLRCRLGPWRHQQWTTQIVDVRRGQLLDVVEGRSAQGPIDWFAGQPQSWRDRIEWATLDLSGPYRKVFNTMLPDAVQVADPFHVIRVANTALDECRRRVQNDTVGHRGRKHDPLYRARRLLTMAAERLPDHRRERLVGLLAAGDPKGEVKLTWHAKEVVRAIYDHTDVELAEAWVEELIRDFADREMPLEVRRLGRTIKRWRDQIVAWHRSHVSNGPTEAINNLVKRVKRVAFGMRRFRNYRLRALLYAGRPNWTLLDTITPP
jgi:transposase